MVMVADGTKKHPPLELVTNYWKLCTSQGAKGEGGIGQDAPHALLYTTSLTEWGEGGRPAPSTVFCFNPLCSLIPDPWFL